MPATLWRASLTASLPFFLPRSTRLRKLTQTDFQKTALVIFQKQISDPVHALIDKLKTALLPFKTAIDKIQAILITLTTLPPKIDAAVAKVLNTARDAIKQLITHHDCRHSDVPDGAGRHAEEDLRRHPGHRRRVQSVLAAEFLRRR